ncbi:hypothetical protein BWGOE4_09570 [Bacillus mycoides]|uniref:hypothetical protein n=1 Tax=Bacillus cereus group TaxID=86661 RepID=UPI00027C0656|nr:MULTISPECIES: hypothetical protein [Bacillus cereus group]EJV56732.1 hypothetical protein IEM_05118 [Bacillus cereus BAG6O-2]OFD36547.1 hypothetical protein BWGOE3_55970 [Bacillus mycoides]OFD57384.1 hypothetical protein BWGOE7_55850 [Bacillus mycoides]OFD63647.1 hypothetical protein BWGOE6_10210 [Bacillus mycoides]OFD65924.1 hypothetical protein BWGOE4_09570 [Bacillus mycoides]
MSFNEFVLDQCGKTWPELKKETLNENQDLTHENVQEIISKQYLLLRNDYEEFLLEAQ